MTIPHRGTPELKVFYVPGTVTKPEMWVLNFSKVYDSRTDWCTDVHGTGGPANSLACCVCQVPPESHEYAFFRRLVRPRPNEHTPAPPDKYFRLCLDCAFDDALANGWADLTTNVPDYVYASNALREEVGNAVG